MIEVRSNKANDGDDPENRYDCDDCAYAPTEWEGIVLISGAEGVEHKLCMDCAEGILRAVLRNPIGRKGMGNG